MHTQKDLNTPSWAPPHTFDGLGLSEVVVALFFVFVHNVFIVVFLVIDSFFVRVVVLRLESANSVAFFPSLLPVLLAESILCLPHFVLVAGEHGVFVSLIVLEHFVLIGLALLDDELVNDLLLLFSPLRVLEVVHVELMLQEINVGKLLDVERIESLELSLQSLVLFLVLRLNVLDALKSLLRSLELLLSSLELVQETAFIEFQIFDGLLHFSLLLSLAVDDVPDALFNVDLLRVGVQVPGNRVQELQGLVPRLLQIFLGAQEVVQLGTRLSDLNRESPGCLQVVKFGSSVEVHHAPAHFFVVVDVLARLHGFVHHGRDFQHLLD